MLGFHLIPWLVSTCNNDANITQFWMHQFFKKNLFKNCLCAWLSIIITVISEKLFPKSRFPPKNISLPKSLLWNAWYGIELSLCPWLYLCSYIMSFVALMLCLCWWPQPNNTYCHELPAFNLKKIAKTFIIHLVISYISNNHGYINLSPICVHICMRIKHI